MGFFLKILALCMVSIQERFQIKSGLWWRGYGNLIHNLVLLLTFFHEVGLGSLSEILALFLKKEKGETNRKSSSMSSTLASKLFEVFSFNSNSRIRFVIIMVFRVIGFPGRCIRNIQGSHWRNSVRTCRHTYNSGFELGIWNSGCQLLLLGAK